MGGTTREWVPGQAWVFDDTIEHEAWNDSDTPRAILIFDIWNPLLSAAEREMITAATQVYVSHYALAADEEPVSGGRSAWLLPALAGPPCGGGAGTDGECQRAGALRGDCRRRPAPGLLRLTRGRQDAPGCNACGREGRPRRGRPSPAPRRRRQRRAASA